MDGKYGVLKGEGFRSKPFMVTFGISAHVMVGGCSVCVLDGHRNLSQAGKAQCQESILHTV